MSEYVKIDWRDIVARVRLARGEKMVALHNAMFKAFAEGGGGMVKDRLVRAVVPPSFARNFGAGLDLDAIRPSVVDERSSDVAVDLIYSGRESSGEHAGEAGLATYVRADSLAKALCVTEAIATRGRDVVRAVKLLLAIEDDAEFGSILDAEASEQHALLGTTNQREALCAAFAGEIPTFANVLQARS